MESMAYVALLSWCNIEALGIDDAIIIATSSSQTLIHCNASPP
jgi:hypothetical protein